MNRTLSSKVNYTHRQTGFDALGDAIASAIHAENKSLSQPQTTKVMTMKPATAKPTAAAPASSPTAPGAFGKLMAKITTCLSVISGAELPTIEPVIPQVKSRDAYPPPLIAQLPAIPESRLASLTTDAQRMQADGRANQTIPNIFKRHGELLIVEDETALSGEQAKLHALLSEFGWYLDGWTDNTRSELRPEIGAK